MPRKSRFFGGGFIDIISLVAVLFLVITTATGAYVVNRENANFDLRNKAAGICGTVSTGCKYYDCSQKIDCSNGKLVPGFCGTKDGGYPNTDPCHVNSTQGTTPPNCIGQGYSCTNDSQCCSNYCVPGSNRCGTNTSQTEPSQPGTQNPPPPSPTQTTTCMDPCTTDTECGNGSYCYKPATGCSVCKTQTCTPNQQICSESILKQCNSLGSGLNTVRICPDGCNNTGTDCQPAPVTTSPTFCTGANDQKMSSSYTCVSVNHGTFSESNGQGCCTLGTAPSGTQTCSLTLKPVCPDGSTPQCNGNTWLPCPIVTQQCTPGKTQCYGRTELQICSGGIIWISQHCDKGCSNGACNLPAAQTTTTTTPATITTTPANTITQTDCTTCLKNNSPSECLTMCLKIGGTITTPLGQKECDPALNPPSCSGSGLKICSSSGYWGLQTCQNGCENNACKSNPLAALNGLGLPSGLSGNSSIPLPQSAVTSEVGFQQYAHTVGSGFVTGGAVGALALGGPVIIPEAITGITATNAVAGGGLLTLPAAALTYTTTSLSTAPTWVTPALTVAGTIPGIISNTKCLIYPESCTVQDQMNTFMTGVGVQQLSEQQAIQNISLQRANTSQIPQTNTLTLYHGAAFKNNASIMKNGIYGVGDGIAPTLTDQIDTAVEYASGQGLSMTGVSVRDPINGGYIYQVDVPIDKVTLSDTLLSGEKVYTLSLNNPAQPGAPYESWKALSPEYIKAIYRVDPNGVITNITELR